MGRITVFSIDNCPHSKRVKYALESRNIPFKEISISLYPQKRNDMICLCDRYSIPQVFFNTRHVGGADETIKILREWDNNNNNGAAAATTKQQGSFTSCQERYEFEIGSRPDPQNPLLDIPSRASLTSLASTTTTTSTTPTDSPEIEEDIQHIMNEEGHDCNNNNSIPLPDGTSTSFVGVTELLKKIIPRSEFQHKHERYKNCFTGKSAVKAIQLHFGTSDDIAESFFEEDLLSKNQVLAPVVAAKSSSNHATLEECWYRLQCHQTPEILNSYRNWGVNEVRSIKNIETINSIIIRLFSLIATIETSITSKNGMVNYKKATEHNKFPILEEAVCQLQKIDVRSINDADSKMAFALNVYNLMLKYAFMKVGIATVDSSSRTTYMDSVKFNVGGKKFSFQDWLHGIIRGNRKAPTCRRAQFGRKDSRKLLFDGGDGDNEDGDRIILSPCQIHFGIFSRFTKNSPPIPYFTMMTPSRNNNNDTNKKITKKQTLNKDLYNSTLHDELNIVSYAYCEDDENIKISYKERQVRLARMFHIYRTDFLPSSSSKRNNAGTHNNNVLLSNLVQFLRGTKKIQLERLLKSDKPIDIRFLDEDEDWTMNVNEYTPFDIDSLSDYTEGSSSRVNETVLVLNPPVAVRSKSAEFPLLHKKNKLIGRLTHRHKLLSGGGGDNNSPKTCSKQEDDLIRKRISLTTIRSKSGEITRATKNVLLGRSSQH